MVRPLKVLAVSLDILICVRTVVGQCGTIPVIDNSENNIVGTPPYPEGSTVEYSCQNLYIPQGNPQYTCTDGEWIGSFTCRIVECSALERPLNGQMIGDNYEVGSVMRFKCDAGYDLVGSDRLLCQSDSNWEPPDEPECQIKSCPTTPLVQHGTVSPEHTVDGQTNVYGVILKVHCDDNYLRTGPARIYCDENGDWTEKPKCEAVTCPPYPDLDANCVLKSKLAASNTLFFLYCTDNATFVHSADSEQSAFCENGNWDDLSLRCYCNCEINANTDFVSLENLDEKGFLKHGESLVWSCKNGTTKASTAALTCNDGSVGTPVCTPAPTLPPTATTTTEHEVTTVNGSTDRNTTDKESTDRNVTRFVPHDEPFQAWIAIIIIVVIVAGALAVAATLVAFKKKYLCFKLGDDSSETPVAVYEKPVIVASATQNIFNDLDVPNEGEESTQLNQGLEVDLETEQKRFPSNGNKNIRDGPLLPSVL